MRITASVEGFALLIVTVSLAIGCASSAPKQPASSPIKLTVTRPAIAALPETEETQERGGLTLIVEPLSYGIKHDSLVNDTPRNPDFLENLGEPKNAYYFTRTVTSTANLEPDRLGFNVRIINGLGHVIRGAGTVVTFTIDGKQTAMADYSDLINAIVTPRGEISLRVWGPELRSLPASCTVGLFFYDFVTETDAAGNPSERQNFEWYYDYKAMPEYVDGHTRTAKMIRR